MLCYLQNCSKMYYLCANYIKENTQPPEPRIQQPPSQMLHSPYQHPPLSMIPKEDQRRPQPLPPMQQQLPMQSPSSSSSSLQGLPPQAPQPQQSSSQPQPQLQPLLPPSQPSLSSPPPSYYNNTPNSAPYYNYYPLKSNNNSNINNNINNNNSIDNNNFRDSDYYSYYGRQEHSKFHDDYDSPSPSPQQQQQSSPLSSSYDKVCDSGNYGNTRLYISGLPDEYIDNDLIEKFEPYGEVSNFFGPFHKDSRFRKNFAFLSLGSHEQCVRAIDNLDGKLQLYPNTPVLSVDFAKARGSNSNKKY